MAGSTAGIRVGDRREVLLASVVGLRCRVQSLRSAKLYHGWFANVVEGAVQFESKAGVLPEHGELVFSEVDSLGSVLRFVGQINVLESGKMWLKITSEIEERKQISEPRLQIPQLAGRIEQGSASVEIVLVDASENGFGFLAHAPVERGGAKVIISSDHGDIAMTIDVRHTCHLADQGCLRGGVKVLSMDRVARARWAKVLTFMQEVE